MKVVRCEPKDMAFVTEAISVVKAEEDDVLADESAIARFLNEDDNYFLVAIESECVVGYAVAYRLKRIDGAGDLLCLYEIGVLREYRQRGIGSALIGELKTLCKKNDFSKMWVPTNKSNTAACGLYQKMGGIVAEHDDEISYTYRF